MWGRLAEKKKRKKKGALECGPGADYPLDTVSKVFWGKLLVCGYLSSPLPPMWDFAIKACKHVRKPEWLSFSPIQIKAIIITSVCPNERFGNDHFRRFLSMFFFYPQRHQRNCVDWLSLHKWHNVLIFWFAGGVLVTQQCTICNLINCKCCINNLIAAVSGD